MINHYFCYCHFGGAASGKLLRCTESSQAGSSDSKQKMNAKPCVGKHNYYMLWIVVGAINVDNALCWSQHFSCRVLLGGIITWNCQQILGEEVDGSRGTWTSVKDLNCVFLDQILVQHCSGMLVRKISRMRAFPYLSLLGTGQFTKYLLDTYVPGTGDMVPIKQNLHSSNRGTGETINNEQIMDCFRQGDKERPLRDVGAET